MSPNGTAENILKVMLKKYRSEGYATEQACKEVEALTGLERHPNVLFDKWLIILLAFVFLIKEIFQIFQVSQTIELSMTYLNVEDVANFRSVYPTLASRTL